MTYEFYKVMHLTSLFMVFSSLGAYFLSAMLGAGRQFPGKRWVAIFHGVGLVLALVSGFGLLARLGLFEPLPIWAYLKLGIWAVLGGIIVIAMRKPQWSKGAWILVLVLGGFAAYLARYKPY